MPPPFRCCWVPPTRLINAAVGHHLSSPTVGPVHHRQPPPNSLHPRAPQISPLATPGYFAGVHLGLSPAPPNSSTPLRSPPRPPLATLQEFTWTSVQHLQTPRHPSHLPPGHPRLLCRSSPGPLSSTSKRLYTPQISPLATHGYFAGVHLGLCPAPPNSSIPLRSSPRPSLATLQEFTWASVSPWPPLQDYTWTSVRRESNKYHHQTFTPNIFISDFENGKHISNLTSKAETYIYSFSLFVSLSLSYQHANLASKNH